MVDRYSRWPEIKIMRRPPDAKMTIAAMDDIYSEQKVYLNSANQTMDPHSSREKWRSTLKEKDLNINTLRLSGHEPTAW
jgi:hypothetical protein